MAIIMNMLGEQPPGEMQEQMLNHGTESYFVFR